MRVGRVLQLCLVPTVALSACSTDECREYSDYTCAELERQTYNAYYFDVEKVTGMERSIFAGQVVGLGACADAASSTAEVYAEEREGYWSHVCCLQTSDSECAEKHR